MNLRHHKHRQDARTVYRAKLWAFDPSLDWQWEECDDWDDWDIDPECPDCRGTGMDRYTDNLLPCSHCQGEQRP